MNANPEPRLARPGAGLPFLELYAGRLLFTLRRWRGDRESFNRRFQQEREIIRMLVKSSDAESAARRVLIPRLRGMEDSSRNWSVWMTLDHLRMVNQGIARIIGALAKETVPPGVSSTAAVKPRPDVTFTVAPAYEDACDQLLATVAATPVLKTSVRYAHPWFGSLDAFGWHALAGGHMAIHRSQIELILKNQPARSAARTNQFESVGS